MASEIRFWVVEPRVDADERAQRAQSVVERVAASCTRFDPQSDLMRANAAGRAWTVVPSECYDAISAAYDAHVATGGLFDPRVLRVLASYGYDATLPFESRRITLPESGSRKPRRGLRTKAWKPGLDPERRAVRIGREPIDLGGIGKGLAVRWATAELRTAGSSVLVEAGGDMVAIGVGPEGSGWMIAVEDPFGGSEPAAVLRVRDRAVATSSTRVRSWTVGQTEVHHLIDPRTRRPAEADLKSVTVVGLDPALAEVWSKSLFVLGREGIREGADSRDLAALWVDVDGKVGVSRAMHPYVAWQVSHVA
jgi:thiamine biosynthesis lipoprotein